MISRPELKGYRRETEAETGKTALGCSLQVNITAAASDPYTKVKARGIPELLPERDIIPDSGDYLEYIGPSESCPLAYLSRL